MAGVRGTAADEGATDDHRLQQSTDPQAGRLPPGLRIDGNGAPVSGLDETNDQINLLLDQ
ncbi:hypothetical protein [Streptomyces deccanensis]|uniref:hypothetical protein n=1 Tax=Streptomyces deccanensis TaxID=424188 RepID=UPI001EFBA712|nr:hypothetical protein [Streptomyces deccanensis]ULR55239.1 hypothetical protein L3078_41505 [Streptomyces deccanensis]